jgi:hypothetical protein
MTVLLLVRHTLRLALRRRAPQLLGLLVALAVGVAWALASLAPDEQPRILADLGHFCITLAGAALAAWLGIMCVDGERARRTLHLVLARPVARWRYLAGRFLGAAVVLAFTVAALGTLLALAGGRDLEALLLIYVQLLVVTSLAMLLSTVATALPAGVGTAGLFCLGHLLPELRALLGRRLPDAAVQVLTLPVPDLHLLRAGVASSGAGVAWAGAYGLCYAGCALALGAWVLGRRDLP